MTLDNVWTPPVEIDPTNNPELTTDIVNEQIFQNLLFLNSTQPFTVVSDWDIVNMNVYQNMVIKHWRITCITGQLLVTAHRPVPTSNYGHTTILQCYFSINGGEYLEFAHISQSTTSSNKKYYLDDDSPPIRVLSFEINDVVDFQLRITVFSNNNNQISTFYTNNVIPALIWARNI